MLTDISTNNVVPQCFKQERADISSEEEWSPSDEDYIPNTAEDLESNCDIPVHKDGKRGTDNLTKEEWKCNNRNKKAITGKSYISKNGQVVPEKKIKPVCACRLKCSERINEDVRSSIFREYYDKSMTWERKRQFIISRVFEVQTAKPKRRNSELPSKRLFTYIYTFLVDGKTEKVCKTFFLNTLAVSETVVRTSLKKKLRGIVLGNRRVIISLVKK